MDTHISGPRKLSYGSQVSLQIAFALFGTTVAGTRLIVQTFGASPKTPLLVRIQGQIKTAFDGTTPAFTLQETNTDNSSPVSLALIAGFTAGKLNLFFFLTVDKKYSLIYTPGGGGTVGEAYYSIELAGMGQLPV